MMLHLEGGGCPSGVDYRHVDARVREMDVGNLVTRPLIGWREEEEEEDTTDYGNVAVSYESYDASRGVWCCPLCPKGFRTAGAVNAHLRSGCHAQKLYRCPNKACGGGFVFTRLSALVQHVESNKCGVGLSRQLQGMLGPRGPLMVGWEG